jgi:hypothetical protein
MEHLESNMHILSKRVRSSWIKLILLSFVEIFKLNLLPSIKLGIIMNEEIEKMEDCD